MRREKPERGRKAPAINVLARHFLARGLMKHPDISKHVSNVDDADDMGMLALMKLADKLGVVDVELTHRDHGAI